MTRQLHLTARGNKKFLLRAKQKTRTQLLPTGPQIRSRGPAVTPTTMHFVFAINRETLSLPLKKSTPVVCGQK